MKPRLFVHIGAPKTGTSYIQSLVWAGKRDFKQIGVLVPGKRQKAHFAAGGDLAGDTGDDYIEQVGRERRPGAWDRFAGRIRESDAPTVVFTDERLARSPRAAAHRLADLAGAREIHVIYTVRAFDLTMPSAWQTYVKHGGTSSLEEWLDSVLGSDEGARAHGHFWRSHDIAAVLERWSAAIDGPTRAHIVTVPRSASDPSVLWRRFAATIGLPSDPPEAAARSNEALDHAQVEALRRLNVRLGETMPPGTRRRVVRNMLATKVMGRLAEGHRAELPARYRPAVTSLTAKTVSAIESGGWNIVGDITDLRVDTTPTEPEVPNEVAIAAATEATLAALVRRLAQES